MINEKKISDHLNNMEALAKTMLSEAAKGRRILQRIQVEKASDMELHIQRRRQRFFKKLNK